MRDQVALRIHEKGTAGLADAQGRDNVPDQLEIDIRYDATLSRGDATHVDSHIRFGSFLKINRADVAPLLPRRDIGIRAAEIRAGASDAPMVSALGVNVKLLNTAIFGLGAGLAGLAGVMVAPIFSVQSGMGDSVLIQTLVVIIVGGVGSIRGAFYAALIIGIVDTVGRAFLPVWMSALMDPSVAAAAGPAIASMLIYLLMAIVLAFKPAGLFPVQSR